MSKTHVVKKKRMKVSFSERIFNLINICIMLVISAIMLAPVIHVVCVSFSVGSEIQKGGLFLWPHGFTLEGYKKVMQDGMILRSYLNTIIYAISHIQHLMSVFITIICCYKCTTAFSGTNNNDFIRPCTYKTIALRKSVSCWYSSRWIFR